MATHAHTPGAPTRVPAIPAALLRRETIEAEIELHLQRVTLLIARLDRVDPDPDLEDDDPAGDTLDEHGEAASDTGARVLPMLPIYGVDQRRGPINERQAHQAHMAVELGLVRSPTGGWKRPS